MSVYMSELMQCYLSFPNVYTPNSSVLFLTNSKYVKSQTLYCFVQAIFTNIWTLQYDVCVALQAKGALRCPYLNI